MRMEGELGTVAEGQLADVLVIDGNPLADIKILQDRGRITEVISRGKRIDLATPLPERKVSATEQVRFLASCPLTQGLALTDTDLERLAHV
jgi:cytosine/adenosine deaminase-related metal-dependent hydrolase